MKVKGDMREKKESVGMIMDGSYKIKNGQFRNLEEDQFDILRHLLAEIKHKIFDITKKVFYDHN